MSDTIHNLQDNLRHTFRDKQLPALALTHPSCNEGNTNNQRLEFLGDAVLELIVAETLYQRHPAEPEGPLDSMRASIVNGKVLADIARTIRLDALLRTGPGRNRRPGPSDAMLEDALEAVIGAVYLDGGLDAARGVVLRLFESAIDGAAESSESDNPKGRLQEWTQRHHGGTIPDYSLLHTHGPDHNRSFTAAVSLDGRELGRGCGGSIKTAESEAAREALKHVRTSQ